MKLSFLLLGIFFLSVAFRANAGDFNFNEKQFLSSFERSEKVKTFMEDEIDIQSLSVKDFLSYKIFKASCDDLKLEMKKVAKAQQVLSDRSKTLSPLLNRCRDGVIGLTNIYLQQKG